MFRRSCRCRGWAKEAHLVDEEVRRADHSARLALMPVGVYRLHRVQAGGEADGSGDAVELILLRDVATFFENEVPQGEAHVFAESDVPVVGGRSQAKRGKRR